MDPYDRYFRRSLRDVLLSEGVLTAEQADELTESAYAHDEPLGSVVVDSGYLTAWDLMQKIAATYQLPILLLDDYKVDDELLKSVPSTVLFHHGVFPLARFGQTWTWAITTPPTRELIASLREHCGPSHFFYAADMTHIQRLLHANTKVVDTSADDSWENIFDSGDEAVQQEIKK